MIEKLTQEQEKLMEEIVQRYEDYSLCGDDTYSVEEIVAGIDFLYGLAEIPNPKVIICNSPLEMKSLAKLKKGETFDWVGCGYDSGWTAFYDYMERIGVDYDKDIGFDKWKNFITKSGVFASILFEHVVFVCIRPCKVKRNKDLFLHCDDGMAISWRDGYGEYFLNGVAVEEDLVMTPAERLDPRILLKETNAEVRREIVRKIGVERVCDKLGAVVVDKSNDGMYELLMLDIGDRRKRPYLKMRNPSIGTYHIEGVHPDCKTVKDALEFRNKTNDKPVFLT